MKYFIFIVAIFCLPFIFSCTDEDNTIRTLKSAGFTEIKTHGYSFLACSEDDTFATKFSATNPQGQRIHGTVCCGLLKSCTIRF